MVRQSTWVGSLAPLMVPLSPTRNDAQAQSQEPALTTLLAVTPKSTETWKSGPGAELCHPSTTRLFSPQRNGKPS